MLEKPTYAADLAETKRSTLTKNYTRRCKSCKGIPLQVPAYPAWLTPVSLLRTWTERQVRGGKLKSAGHRLFVCAIQQPTKDGEGQHGSQVPTTSKEGTTPQCLPRRAAGVRQAMSTIEGRLIEARAAGCCATGASLPRFGWASRRTTLRELQCWWTCIPITVMDASGPKHAALKFQPNHSLISWEEVSNLYLHSTFFLKKILRFFHPFMHCLSHIFQGLLLFFCSIPLFMHFG